MVRDNKALQKLEKTYLGDSCYNNKSIRKSIVSNLTQNDSELFACKILNEKEIKNVFENVINENNERSMQELLSQLYPLLQETIKENIVLEESISKNMKFLPR